MQTVNKFKVWAAAIVLAYSIYGLFTKSFGDAIFGILIATLLFLGEQNLTLVRLTQSFRNKFYNSDDLARKILVIVSLGMTALIIDMVYGLDMLPTWLDVWVKRLSPALFLICITLYFTSLISKRVFMLAEVKKDNKLISYELSLYLVSVIYMGTVVITFLGIPMEKIIPSSRDFVEAQFSWSKNNFKVLGVILSISTVWIYAFRLCILSRYFEWSWMLKNKK